MVLELVNKDEIILTDIKLVNKEECKSIGCKGFRKADRDKTDKDKRYKRLERKKEVYNQQIAE